MSIVLLNELQINDLHLNKTNQLLINLITTAVRVFIDSQHTVAMR